MPTTIPDPRDPHRPMSAERLREIIVLSVAEHPEIAGARNAGTLYADRRALVAVDLDGLEWRIHVMREPREVAA